MNNDLTTLINHDPGLALLERKPSIPKCTKCDMEPMIKIYENQGGWEEWRCSRCKREISFRLSTIDMRNLEREGRK